MPFKTENRNWGAYPPRVLLDAPRVQPLACVTDTEISTHPMFSARARKTAPEAGALPINFGIQVETANHAKAATAGLRATGAPTFVVASTPSPAGPRDQ